VRTAAFLAALALALGCVSQERRDVAAASEAYEQCIAEHPPGDPECTALRERLLSAQQRYESNARRAWGCTPESGDCPSHR
jgi:hypothetical protein